MREHDLLRTSKSFTIRDLSQSLGFPHNQHSRRQDREKRGLCDTDLGLSPVPRQHPQGWRHSHRSRGSGQRPTALHPWRLLGLLGLLSSPHSYRQPAVREVLRIARPPRRLHPSTTRGLTRRLTTGALSRPHPRIRPEKRGADAATLPSLLRHATCWDITNTAGSPCPGTEPNGLHHPPPNSSPTPTSNPPHWHGHGSFLATTAGSIRASVQATLRR